MMMTRCSCTAPRCSDHGEHAPCSVCRDLDARQAATLVSLALGALGFSREDEDVLLALQEMGLTVKARVRGSRRWAWVATPEGLAAIRRDVKPLFVERHQ